MVKPKEERFREFWSSLQEMFLLMHTFPRPLIAAINGNSPAGGCIMSLCCDYRIMAKGPAARPDRAYRIGLNETKLGLVAPPWLMANYSYVLGSERKAERLLMLGETPTAEEAKAMGLVDEVVEEGAVMAAAEAEVKRQLAIPSDARWMTKDLMRRSVIELLANPETREYDTDFHAQMIGGPEMQKNLAAYLERLKKK
jgi:3,2-trans-enoyl-CoA isomerase